MDTTGWAPHGSLRVYDCIEEQMDSTWRRAGVMRNGKNGWLRAHYSISRTVECEHDDWWVTGWSKQIAVTAKIKRASWEWHLPRSKPKSKNPWLHHFQGRFFQYFQRVFLASPSWRRGNRIAHPQTYPNSNARSGTEVNGSIIADVVYDSIKSKQYLGAWTHDGQPLSTVLLVRGGWVGGGEWGPPEGTANPGRTNMVPDTIYFDVEISPHRFPRERVDVRFPLDARRTGRLRWVTWRGAARDSGSVSLEHAEWPNARTLRFYVPAFRGWQDNPDAVGAGPDLVLKVETDTIELSSGDGWGVADYYERFTDRFTTPVFDAVHWRHQPDQEEEEEEEEEAEDNTQYETPWLQLDRWTNEADSIKLAIGWKIYADTADREFTILRDDVAGPGPWELPPVPTEADSVYYEGEVAGYFHHGNHGFVLRETKLPNTTLTARWQGRHVEPPGTDFCPSSGRVSMRERPVLVVHATQGAATGELCVRAGETAVHLENVRAGVKESWMLPEGITSVTARNWTRPSGEATGWVFADVKLSRWAPPGWMAGSREIMVLPAPGN